MRWHYNLVHQSGGALVRDMVVYDSGLVAGQAVSLIAGANQCALQDPSGATLPDIVGVTCNAPSASTAIASGTLYFAKTIMNPDAVYLAEYDMTTTADIDVISSTATATTLGACDDNLDGGWLYVNTGTGAGQLAFIGAANAVSVMTLDTTAPWDVTPDATSDVILVRPPFAKNKDLEATWTKLASDEDETGLMIVLENYIQAQSVAWGPLRPRQHHMLTNLSSAGLKLMSDVMFEDNVLWTKTWCT